MNTRDPKARVALVRQPTMQGNAKPAGNMPDASIKITGDLAATWQRAAGILEEKDIDARKAERVAKEVRGLQNFMALPEWATGLRLLKAARSWVPIGVPTPGTTSRYWLGGSGFARTSTQIQSRDVSDLSKHLKNMEILHELPDTHLKQLIDNYIREVGLTSTELLTEYLIRMISSVARGAVAEDKPKADDEPKTDEPKGDEQK